MSDFVAKLRLKGQAEEDIYFARKDIALIEALHTKNLGKIVGCSDRPCKVKAQAFERRFDALRDKRKKSPRKFLLSLRSLLEEIRKTCKHLDRSA